MFIVSQLKYFTIMYHNCVSLFIQITKLKNKYTIMNTTTLTQNCLQESWNLLQYFNKDNYHFVYA